MGSDSRWRCVLVLWTLLGSTQAGWISGVCNNETASPNQPPHPDLPAQFEAFVQCNMVDMNLTYLVHEYFDYSSNMGRLTQMGNGAKGDLYYDYGNNELLNFDRINGGCKVTNITTDDNRFLFGVKSKGSENHIFSAAGALHFEQGTERYLGTDVVRGIRVEKWYSCQYMPVLDATVNVTWYFSDKSAWDTDIGKRSVPVRAVVVGKIYDGNNVRSFNHIYDFFHFRDAINPMDLQLESGDYCQNRIKQVPFPKLPDVFSITGEMINFSEEATLTIEDDDQPTYLYNGFSFDLDRPLTWKLDVSSCFHGAQRINVRFAVDGGYKSAVTYNIENFKAALRSAVSLFLGVSQLQIADIEVYTGDPSITVTFDLLDAPPTAQDNNSPRMFNSLNNALSLLISPSTTIYFEISVLNGQTVTTVPLLNNSGRIFFSNGTCLGCDLLYSPTFAATSSGYSAGALGGLVVAMIILGGAFGVVGGYFMFGRQGPQSGIVTLRDMEPGS